MNYRSNAQASHSRKRIAAILSGCLVAAVFLVMCAPRVKGTTGAQADSAARATLSPAAELGRQIFFDKNLSASRRMACATCHDPRFAYGPPNGLAVQYGGPLLKSSGYRAVPSLRYVLNYVPVWTHVRDTNPIEQLTEADTSPAGGYTWDGRYNSLHAQAMLPFFSPVEMDNGNVTELAGKLKQATYADEFRTVFGERIFESPAQAVEKATLALEQFELQDKSFHPYSSKYDRWLDGKATLTAQELHGKRLFEDPQKGNCASCHLDQKGANGAHPIFTDFQFEALGVPRNNAIPWNADPHYNDMGLCGPFRNDGASKDPTNCGLFRTPSLRNTAMRQVFFHNGSFHSLRDALRFYVQRDTNPEKWYPKGPDGKVEKFNDLPLRYRRNVDTFDAPLNLHRGQKPVWDEQDISDVIAFLKTLVDEDVLDKENALDTR